jgi:hypothetical protein
MAGHATPGGQVGGRSGAARDHLELLARFHLIHAAAELENELTAPDVTSVPSFFQAPI